MRSTTGDPVRIVEYWAKITGSSGGAKYHAWADGKPLCDYAKYVQDQHMGMPKKVRLDHRPGRSCASCIQALKRYKKIN